MFKPFDLRYFPIFGDEPFKGFLPASQIQNGQMHSTMRKGRKKWVTMRSCFLGWLLKAFPDGGRDASVTLCSSATKGRQAGSRQQQ